MAGVKVGAQIVVGDPTTGTPVLHSTTGIDDGRMLVGYVDGTSVSAQFLDNRQPGISLIGPRTGAPADVIVGTVGDDAIDGRALNDQLFGGLGNDFITMGSGADQGFGGDGNDTIIGGTGQDQLFGEAGDDLLWGGLSGPIEPQVDRDLVTGLTAAGVSAALIATDPGADIISGGAGIDTISYQGEFGNFNVDLASGIVTSDRDLNGSFILEDVIGAIVDDGAGGTIFQFSHDIENATGGIGDDTLAGDAGANILLGLGGNDILIGRGGNDTLDGGDGTDVAVFTGAIGNYTFTLVAGAIVVHALTGTDGNDTVRNVETFRFSNGAGGTTNFSLAQITALVSQPQVAATGTPVISDTTPTAGQILSIDLSSIADLNGIPATPAGFSYQWQRSTNGTTWTSINAANNPTYHVPDAPGITQSSFAGQQLRVIVSFVDGLGHAESRTSAATAPIGMNYDATGFAAVVANGLAGGDTLIGSAFADTVSGFGGNDILFGAAGNDTLLGGAGDDVITGGAGDDTIRGADGIDTIVYSGPVTNYSLMIRNNTIVVADVVGTEGTDNIVTSEILRFGGADYGIVMGTGNADVALNGGAGSHAIFGQAGADVITGGSSSDIINGGFGGDIVNGGGGDDFIFHVSGEGRDTINGGAGTDTFILTGDATAETFTIMTRALALSHGMTNAQLGATTDIVITRNGTNFASVVALLTSIEEIKINTLLTSVNNGNGVVDSSVQNGLVQGDTIVVQGDFTQTSLAFNTIRIEGSNANDTIDISGLTSAHRVVFDTNGGNDTFIGGARPQDIVDGIPRISADTLHIGGSVESDFALLEMATRSNPHVVGAGAAEMHLTAMDFHLPGLPLGVAHDPMAIDFNKVAVDYSHLLV